MDELIAAVRCFYEANGELPNTTDISFPYRAPVLPRYQVFTRLFAGAPWDEVARRLAQILDVRGGKYGLPEDAPNPIAAYHREKARRSGILEAIT